MCRFICKCLFCPIFCNNLRQCCHNLCNVSLDRGESPFIIAPIPSCTNIHNKRPLLRPMKLYQKGKGRAVKTAPDAPPPCKYYFSVSACLHLRLCFFSLSLPPLSPSHLARPPRVHVWPACHLPPPQVSGPSTKADRSIKIESMMQQQRCSGTDATK